MATATWLNAPVHGELTTKKENELPDTAFAFPHQRKEPLTDAGHVRNAIARFDQVKHVSDSERDIAFANIRKAAKHYGVKMEETDWRQLGRTPHKASRS